MGSSSTEVGIRRLQRVEHVMGTVIGVDVRDEAVAPAVLEKLFAYLRAVDERFSTYKPDSEVSRVGRGELAEADASPDLRHVLALCDDLFRTTGGYFDARHQRAAGGLDPSGLVKGWSVEEAAHILDRAGARNYSINAGGDVIARGEPEPGRGWRVGLRHPLARDRVTAVLVIRDRSIATSGLYERGEHILDPHTGRSPRGLLSLTVVGPSLTYVDAYATAAFAMGREGVAWVAGHPGYGAYAVTDDERVVWTADVEPLLA